MNHENIYIYGKHAVQEALDRVPHAVKHLYFVSGQNSTKFLEQGRTLGISYDNCDVDHLPRGVDRDVVHQGVLALVSPSKIMVPFKKFMDELVVKDATGLVLLDELTDPHNVGAVIRSAAAFGVSAVLIPEHRQAQITGTVVKVSAGMAFALPLVQVINVNNAIRDLKDKGFWVYGLTSGGATKLADERFTKPSVFVLGNEGKGIREKTEELCDFKLSVPISSKCESLNAAVSAGVVLYAWKTQATVLENK
ncbi:MAG: 23S rRNA (guanosine(2251)-2'-O)-methyltransferase RlmB [Candidatus Pacebacteria bacterium]|nr:23S rRNA (guanosine(2251)-2'-O)-methyltransferase RlmB [Candidatus Paceibacterota bacterium]